MRNRRNQKIDHISWPLAWLMGILFGGGLLLVGSDFVGFPWGQVIGLGMLVAMATIANLCDVKTRGKHHG